MFCRLVYVDSNVTNVLCLLCGCLVSPAGVFSQSCSLVHFPPGGSLWFSALSVLSLVSCGVGAASPSR